VCVGAAIFVSRSFIIRRQLRRRRKKPNKSPEKGKCEAMNATPHTAEDLASRDYNYGFITAIETDKEQ
jgi:hypothetical protein